MKKYLQFMLISALSYSLGKNMYKLSIMVTHTQNTVRGKRMGPPAILTSIKNFYVDKCTKSFQVCNTIYNALNNKDILFFPL